VLFWKPFLNYYFFDDNNNKKKKHTLTSRIAENSWFTL